ncbi:MAG: SGNH/GDSL hydrolase family protein [Gammaproteobacteria bacterium]|nr:SGNH/GDSL hydrolase family protein [Gammaproteobacteria bacterium]
MGHLLATIGLGPLLLLQGLHTRQRTPRLPEAPGARQGVTGDGPSLRLLIAGDSAAAGVGAQSQDEALSGQLVAGLSPRFQLHWRLLATTGWNTRDTLNALRAQTPEPFDVVVTSLGVNDVTSGTMRANWRAQQAALRDHCRQSLGVKQFILSGLPPMHGFPALPQPLRWYLGNRAKQLDADLRRDVEGEADCIFLPLDFMMDAKHMAHDGFHPGPAIYAKWGEKIIEQLDYAYCYRP